MRDVWSYGQPKRTTFYGLHLKASPMQMPTGERPAGEWPAAPKKDRVAHSFGEPAQNNFRSDPSKILSGMRLQSGRGECRIEYHGWGSCGMSARLMRSPVAARPVRLLVGEDFKCALMGSLGFSTRLIMEHTSLTPSQVGYRLRLGGIKRSDYRNGTSVVAMNLLRKARVVAVPVVREHLLEIINNRQPSP